jgi:hypothetical protein
MSASADVIEKIKKLLRLARSSNPHEAKLALARALELAREHRVNIEGLNPDQAAKETATTHRETACVSRVSYDKRYALLIVKKFFRVSVVEVQGIVVVKGWPRAGWRIAFVGTATDIEVAIYVYAFLTHHFARCWNHRATLATARANAGRLRNRHAFVHGMMLGIYTKLLQQMPEDASPESTALAVVQDDQRRYIQSVYGALTEVKNNRPSGLDSAAASAGFAAGRNTEIRSALKAPAEQTLALA